jgi:hypothetical protein
LEIAGKVIRDRKDRVAFLKEQAGVSVFGACLEDLLPKPGKKVKDGIQTAQLILITSQEIDELGETDNLAQARLQIDGVLSHVRRGVRILADHGTAKLTTRFFSVQITGMQGQASLFGFEPPTVRIELRANKKCVSYAMSASYGFEDTTGEVKLKVSRTGQQTDRTQYCHGDALRGDCPEDRGRLPSRCHDRGRTGESLDGRCRHFDMRR